MIPGRFVPSDIYEGASAPEASGLWAIRPRNSADWIALSGSVSCICHWLRRSRNSWSGWLSLAISPDFDCRRWVDIWNLMKLQLTARIAGTFFVHVFYARRLFIFSNSRTISIIILIVSILLAFFETHYELWSSLPPCSSHVRNSRQA